MKKIKLIGLSADLFFTGIYCTLLKKIIKQLTKKECPLRGGGIVYISRLTEKAQARFIKKEKAFIKGILKPV